MRYLLPFLLALALATPTNAGLFRTVKHAVCKTAAVVMFPVVAPAEYVTERAALIYFYSRGDWRMAGYLDVK